MSASSTSPDLARLVDGRRAHDVVVALAAAECAGRGAGSAGELRAARHLQERLRSIGGRPLAGAADFADPFALTVSELTAPPTLSLAAPPNTACVHLRDFCVDVQGAAGSGHVTAPTTWLGALAASDDLPAELSGRIGVCWSTPPSSGDQLQSAFEAYLQRVQRVRDAGVSGLLQIVARADRHKVMAHCHQEPGIPVLDVTPEVGRALFAPYPPVVGGQPGAAVALDVALARRAVHSAGNLVASVGTGPVGTVLVAHYDHLGLLPDGRHFPGAADNASGVAAVLEAAAAIASVAGQLQRRLLVVLSAAEEAGMYGATRFVDQHAGQLDPTVRILCVDEIAGLGDRPLPLLASAGWRARPELMAGCRALDVGIQVRPLPPFGFADHVAFCERGLPLVACLTDPAVEDVAHTLHDTPERVEPARLAAAARALIAIALPALG